MDETTLRTILAMVQAGRMSRNAAAGHLQSILDELERRRRGLAAAQARVAAALQILGETDECREQAA